MYSAKLISEPEYTINVPGFEHLTFSESSQKLLRLPDAVDFCKKKGGVLQSAREAVAMRIAMNGEDFANEYQMTRTAAIYFKQGNDFFVAFNDDPVENILLTQSAKEDEIHLNFNPLVQKRGLLKAMIDRAEKNDHVVPANGDLELRLDGMYEKNKAVQAILGDIAPLYSAWLQQYGIKNGYVRTLSAANCEDLGVTSRKAEIRRVGSGGADIDVLLAVGRCVSIGFARRVRKKSP
jgi:hypothetical protein